MDDLVTTKRINEAVRNNPRKKRINEAVRNNPRKFREGYMLELSSEESAVLRSKFLTLEP